MRLPNYELLPTSMLRGLEDAAVAVTDSSSIARNLLKINWAIKLPLVDVSAEAVILVPLFTTTDAVVMNFTTLAEGICATRRSTTTKGNIWVRHQIFDVLLINTRSLPSH